MCCIFQPAISTLTVKDCIGYLKYVLTELIPIARYTDMHVMVDKINISSLLSFKFLIFIVVTLLSVPSR